MNHCTPSTELIHDDLIKSLQVKLAETQHQYKETETKLSDAIRKIEKFEKDIKVFEEEAKGEKASEVLVLQQQIQVLTLQLESKNEEAANKLSNAIKKIEQFENDVKKCEEITEGNLSTVLELQQKIQELELQLVSKDDDLKSEVSKTQECSSEKKVCQGRLISVEREKNEALQAQAAAEKAVASIAQSKDKVIEKLESKLEETQKQEERQKELYRRSQDDKRKVERTVSELERVLRTRQIEAKKHYCNVTMFFDDIIAYTRSTGKTLNRKLGPLLVPMKKKGKTFFTKVRLQTTQAYRKYAPPIRKSIISSTSNFYKSHAQVHVEGYVRPLYEKHLASHVKRLCILTNEMQTSLYLFAVSCIKDTSRELLSVMEQKQSQPGDGIKDKKKYPDWLFNALRSAAKNAEDLVQATAKVLRWLVYLFICRFILRLLWRMICLPFRAIQFITGKKKKATTGKGEFKKPQITMV